MEEAHAPMAHKPVTPRDIPPPPFHIQNSALQNNASLQREDDRFAA